MIEMDQLHKVLQFIFQPVMNYNQQKKNKDKRNDHLLKMDFYMDL